MISITNFLLFCVPAVSALYSVHYYAPSQHAGVVGEGVEFSRTPSSTQVADIFARLVGHAPLLNEGTIIKFSYLHLTSAAESVSLPAADIFHARRSTPVLLSLVGEGDILVHFLSNIIIYTYSYSERYGLRCCTLSTWPYGAKSEGCACCEWNFS